MANWYRKLEFSIIWPWGRGFVVYYFQIILLFLFMACENPRSTVDCGALALLVDDSCECIDHAQQVNSSCSCDTLYHVSLDSTECILDSTMTDFSWQLTTIGEYGSSLRSVSIVSDSDIWAVGKINIVDQDSSYNGTGFEPYNALHWNGNEWEYQYFYNRSLQLSDIVYNSDSDIWVLSSIPLHWNGSGWTIFDLWDMNVLRSFNGDLEKICPLSTTSLVFIGKKGSIVYFDGDQFHSIQTGIDTDFRDMKPSPCGEYVFVVGDPIHRNGETVLVKIHLSTLMWESLEAPFDSPLEDAYSLSIVRDQVFVPCSDGLWVYNYISGESIAVYNSTVSAIQVFSTTASEINDILFCGRNFEFIHFNGSSYRRINAVMSQFNKPLLEHAAYTDGVAIMVGEYDQNTGALIAQGKKRN